MMPVIVGVTSPLRQQPGCECNRLFSSTTERCNLGTSYNSCESGWAGRQRRGGKGGFSQKERGGGGVAGGNTHKTEVCPAPPVGGWGTQPDLPAFFFSAPRLPPPLNCP